MLFGVIATPTRAATVLSYSGNPYDVIGDPTLGVSLNGYITFDVLPLAFSSPGLIDSWSFTSGNYTLDQTNSSLSLYFPFLTPG